jgi:hypothetical protein
MLGHVMIGLTPSGSGGQPYDTRCRSTGTCQARVASHRGGKAWPAYRMSNVMSETPRDGRFTTASAGTAMPRKWACNSVPCCTARKLPAI